MAKKKTVEYLFVFNYKYNGNSIENIFKSTEKIIS